MIESDIGGCGDSDMCGSGKAFRWKESLKGENGMKAVDASTTAASASASALAASASASATALRRVNHFSPILRLY